MGNIYKNLLNSRRNWKFSGIFQKLPHFQSHSCRFLLLFWSTFQNIIKIGNSGIKLNRVWQNLGQKHLIYSEMRWKLRKMGWVYVFGCQTHLVHDNKWGGGGMGPLKFSKIILSDHGVHLNVLQTSPPRWRRGSTIFLRKARNLKEAIAQSIESCSKMNLCHQL